MSTSVTSVVNHFPYAQNGFTTTLASTISSGATTVPLNSVAGYTNGQTAVFVVDPSDLTKKQTFTGVVDTAGVQITSVVWTAGTNQTHSGGATVVDYATATHISMVTKGLLVSHNQDGTLKTSAVSSSGMLATGVVTSPKKSTDLQKGWESSYGGTTFPAPDTVTCNGNRSYSLVFNSVDLSGSISAGQRIRTTRTVAAPTQCTSLNGTTQYYSKTSPAGMTFTDDFVVSAWVKLSAYSTTSQVIASRYNGTSGWAFYLESSGQVSLLGANAGAGNISKVTSYQSIPVGKWVHISAQLDMSTFTATTTTSYVMFDGVDVPASVVRSGTNPTALVQAGNLEIGSQNGGAQPFNGKIAQVAIYNAKVTQATITASISQTLSGSETSLISAYSFNNSINDLNTGNANNLTANGSAVATNADSPFGAQADGTISSTLDYGIVQKVSYSTNTTVTVQVPEGCTIPTSGGVTSVVYSSNKAPYGMPTQRGKWTVETVSVGASTAISITGVATWIASNLKLTIPTGEWMRGISGTFVFSSTVSGLRQGQVTLSDTTPTNGIYNQDLTSFFLETGATDGVNDNHRVAPYSASTATVSTVYGSIVSATGTETWAWRGDLGRVHLYAENAYL